MAGGVWYIFYMKPRLKYSLKKQTFKLWFNGKTYVGTCLEDFPVNDIRKDYDFNEETLEKAKSKARGDLRRRHGAKKSGKQYKRGVRGWKKPGYTLQNKKPWVEKFKVTETAYLRALTNVEWCKRMKQQGYNTLPDWLECRKVICEYTGVPYEESVEKENYYSL